MNVSGPTVGGTSLSGPSLGGVSAPKVGGVAAPSVGQVGAEMDNTDLEGDLLGAPEDTSKKPRTFWKPLIRKTDASAPDGSSAPLAAMVRLF